MVIHLKLKSGKSGIMVVCQNKSRKGYLRLGDSDIASFKVFIGDYFNLLYNIDYQF